MAKKDRKDFYDVIRRTGVDPGQFRVCGPARSRIEKNIDRDRIAHGRQQLDAKGLVLP